ncbi:hypothetical protein [Embleya sp. MST-111070]|uniref:hypothetical protein n=1 Tax=Embleya sp. MST-111070 TaxID=3398231 RepID=UPI003F738E46
MIAIGFLLAAATAAFVGLLIGYNTSGGPEYTVRLLHRDLVTLDTLDAFLAGLALALIFCAGLALMGDGARTRRLAHDVRSLDRSLHARAARPATTEEWQADGAAHPHRADTSQPPGPPPRNPYYG